MQHTELRWKIHHPERTRTGDEHRADSGATRARALVTVDGRMRFALASLGALLSDPRRVAAMPALARVL